MMNESPTNPYVAIQSTDAYSHLGISEETKNRYRRVGGSIQAAMEDRSVDLITLIDEVQEAFATAARHVKIADSVMYRDLLESLRGVMARG